MNDYIQTDGHALIEAKRRVRTEAPGHHCFAHPPVHWPRAAAPPPLFCLRLLPGAMGCCLGPTPTHCEGRLGGAVFWETSSRSRSISIESIWKIVKKSYQHNHDNPLSIFFLHALLSNGKSNLFKTKVAWRSWLFRYIWKSYENPVWDSSKPMSTYMSTK